jgi:hypothetical protein
MVQYAIIGFVALFCIGSLMTLIVVGIENHTLNTTIVDCTEPGGKCFEDGRARTGQVVVDIGDYTRRVVILTESCNDKPGVDTTDELTKCVDSGLKREAL